MSVRVEWEIRGRLWPTFVVRAFGPGSVYRMERGSALTAAHAKQKIDRLVSDMRRDAPLASTGGEAS